MSWLVGKDACQVYFRKTSIVSVGFTTDCHFCMLLMVKIRPNRIVVAHAILILADMTLNIRRAKLPNCLNFYWILYISK